MDVQRLSKAVADPYGAAHKYYQILSVLNDLYLSEGEIQLVAFGAIRGDLTDSDIRKEFCEKYKTTVATINNMVWRLKKKNVIVKTGKKLFINPALTKLKFDKSITLVITLPLTQSHG